MRLHQQITESQHPDKLVDLTLKEIVTAGRVTNPYQTYVLGLVSNAVKNAGMTGALYLEGPVAYGSSATSIEVTQAMKALTAPEQVALATYLLDCIAVGGTALHDDTMSLGDWTKFVLQRQD